jgi:hypothetical protein
MGARISDKSVDTSNLRFRSEKRRWFPTSLSTVAIDVCAEHVVQCLVTKIVEDSTKALTHLPNLILLAI